MLRNQTLRLAAQARPSLRTSVRANASKPSSRAFSVAPIRLEKKNRSLKPGQVDEHARIFDPDARDGTAAAATSEGGDVTKSRPVDVQSARIGKNLEPGQVDEHARVFDPDARQGTAAAAASSGGDFTQSRPVDISTSRRESSASPAPDSDAGSAVDPGYTSPSSSNAPPASRPSTSSDPFPLPFSSSVDLSSPSQSDQLEDYGAPIRVPGRENGSESREVRIRRLIYQTRKRGILETDLLLSTFADRYLWTMPEEEIEEFDRLLDEPDWDIYYWLVARKPVPDRWRESFETKGRLGDRLRVHTKNEEGELRRMPGEGPQELKRK